MKKFLKYYLPLLLIISSFGIYLIGYHKNVVKSLISDGKIMFPAKNAVIKMDGIEIPDAKIFESEESFYLVSDSVKDLNLLIIVKPANDVILPNGGCHELLFSNFLFLADCAKGKFYSFDLSFNTQLKISNSDVNFIIPNHKIEILFKGE